MVLLCDIVNLHSAAVVLSNPVWPDKPKRASAQQYRSRLSRKLYVIMYNAVRIR